MQYVEEMHELAINGLETIQGSLSSLENTSYVYSLNSLEKNTSIYKQYSSNGLENSHGLHVC